MLDEEKRGMRRKEGRGGRRDGENEKMKKLLKKWNMRKSLKDASLASFLNVSIFSYDAFEIENCKSTSTVYGRHGSQTKSTKDWHLDTEKSESDQRNS